MSKVSKKYDTQVWFERIIWQDKKSAFRVSQADRYVVRVHLQGVHSDVIMREWVFPTKDQSDDMMRDLRMSFDEKVRA